VGVAGKSRRFFFASVTGFAKDRGAGDERACCVPVGQHRADIVVIREATTSRSRRVDDAVTGSV
jgi:hypothetical protein